jgi:hypothetical protein
MVRTGRCSAILLIGLLGAFAPTPAAAWGDEGHRITALVADHFLEPAVRAKIEAMLAADIDDLTAHDIASEATWADRYRDSDRGGSQGSQERYRGTREWHYVNIEIDGPDLARACFEHPLLPAGAPASRGPAHACIVGKIDQFAAELADGETNADERLVALKFLLHLVGDVHQPLHAADDHDAGGNSKRISAGGLGAGNLHELFDIELVEHLGTDPQQIASYLISRVSDRKWREWSRGSAAAWAMQSFEIARDHAYARLPPPASDRSYRLPPAYIEQETRDVAVQLSKAGVRLAFVMNDALGGERAKRR